MTRKDYIIIAKAINSVRKDALNNSEIVAITRIVQELCVELSRDNSNFDGEKFADACLNIK